MAMPDNRSCPIGIFDSGYGGLTVFKEIVALLPQYDFIYLGDNARSPYGSRSFETVYSYTKEAVSWLFKQKCPLVILACNTASAKALRSIQQRDLPILGLEKRVLGVIRPVTEAIGNYTTTGHVGIFATSGTVRSDSYTIEINKFFPHVCVTLEACPLFVPLVENSEIDTIGSEYFVKKHINALLSKDPLIDTVILGCTHYPLLINQIREHLPQGSTIINQGALVAKSLKEYLMRHEEIELKLGLGESRTFFTTEQPAQFNELATMFCGHPIDSIHATID